MLDSTATFVAHGCGTKRHLVHARRVLECFDGVAELLSRSNGMKNINARVAVSQTTVIVGGHVEVI